jgi:spore maturation protein CgeB
VPIIGRMKILFVDTLYGSVLEKIGYLRDPISGDTEESLNSELNVSPLSSGPAYSEELRARGHEVEVRYANAQRAQLASVKSGTSYKFSQNWFWSNWQLISRIPLVGSWIYRNTAMTKIMVSQILNSKPDVVYFLNINLLDSNIIKLLKEVGITVVGQHASPLPPKSLYKGIDHIFSAHPGQVRHFKERGISATYLPLAFTNHFGENSSAKPWSERSLDVTFVGTFGRHQKSTGPLLRAIAEKVKNLNIYTNSSISQLKKLNLEKYYRGNAWGKAMYKVLADSKIAINRHGEVAGGYAVNFRLFEATGMGALLLTESALNIKDLFEPDVEVLTYSSIPDAVEKIQRVLVNPSKYEKVANAGKERTQLHHTYKQRVLLIEQALIRISKI